MEVVRRLYGEEGPGETELVTLQHWLLRYGSMTSRYYHRATTMLPDGKWGRILSKLCQQISLESRSASGMIRKLSSSRQWSLIMPGMSWTSRKSGSISNNGRGRPVIITVWLKRHNIHVSSTSLTLKERTPRSRGHIPTQIWDRRERFEPHYSVWKTVAGEDLTNPVTNSRRWWSLCLRCFGRSIQRYGQHQKRN